MPGLLPLPYLRHISHAKRGFANLDLGSRAVQSPEPPTQQEQDPRAHHTDQPQQFGNRSKGNALQAPCTSLREHPSSRPAVQKIVEVKYSNKSAFDELFVKIDMDASQAIAGYGKLERRHRFH